jgi:hypothetical protein
MQKIRLKNINCVKDKYSIYLDSEKIYYFENKRKAEDFLRVVSKNLTVALYFANEEYCTVDVIYRQYFFIIKDFKKRMLIENSLELSGVRFQ